MVATAISPISGPRSRSGGFARSSQNLRAEIPIDSRLRNFAVDCLVCAEITAMGELLIGATFRKLTARDGIRAFKGE